MNRRKAMYGIAVIPFALGSTGCLHVLVRLFVGRGTAGVLARSSRVGGARLGTTFGRGVATGSSLSRSIGVSRNAANVPRSQILDSNGRSIASTRPEEKGTYTQIKGSDVLYSRRTSYGHDHEFQHGSAGRSIRHQNGWVEHKDNRGRRVGFDQIRLAKRVIDHLNANQEKIGETRITSQAENTYLETDESAVRSFEIVEKALGLNCPDAKRAYDDWTANQELCLNSNKNCGLNEIKRQSYLSLRAACNRTQ